MKKLAAAANRKETEMAFKRAQTAGMSYENTRSRICTNVANEISIKLAGGTKHRVSLNPVFISITIITYFCACQSLISTGKDVKSNKLGGDLNSWSLDEAIVNPDSPEAYRTQLSPFVFAAAEPAPAPTPRASRLSSPRAHREPPISGSIFGKRSADSQSNKASISSSQAKLAETSQVQQEFSTSRKDKKQPTSEPLSYKDIITSMIEDFLALNKESEYLR